MSIESHGRRLAALERDRPTGDVGFLLLDGRQTEAEAMRSQGINPAALGTLFVMRLAPERGTR